ncbi:MAG: hypothetical protein KDA89_09805 [Planctomycetaceae bacterium]|nr:hypothetical protein [Planctomycetaceae bacterium]
MSRRRVSGDLQFGSDSFLDIIANIVGILIILIVVAGVKVARQPAASTIAAAADAAGSVTADILRFPPAEDLLTGNPPPAVDPVVIAQPELSPDPFVIPDRNAPSDVPAVIEPLSDEEATEFKLRIDNLSLQLKAAQESTAATETELFALLDQVQNAKLQTDLQQKRTTGTDQECVRQHSGIQELTRSLEEVETATGTFQQTLRKLDEREQQINSSLKEVGHETRQLKEVLEKTEQSSTAAERLQHRLSPVGESTADGELHFRLCEGHIAEVPLEALLERLKQQVAGRQSVVMRFHRYEGVVGPVGGFHMQYIVERESVSPLQALQYGQNAYRISVSRWSILPADTLAAESVEEALRIGSRFRQVLEAAEPDTVITIWLYPNDFRYFRPLRELAHNLNLRVAARPLPQGTPIAGSPNGSRSTSQ